MHYELFERAAPGLHPRRPCADHCHSSRRSPCLWSFSSSCWHHRRPHILGLIHGNEAGDRSRAQVIFPSSPASGRPRHQGQSPAMPSSPCRRLRMPSSSRSACSRWTLPPRSSCSRSQSATSLSCSFRSCRIPARSAPGLAQYSLARDHRRFAPVLLIAFALNRSRGYLTALAVLGFVAVVVILRGKPAGDQPKQGEHGPPIAIRRSMPAPSSAFASR